MIRPVETRGLLRRPERRRTDVPPRANHSALPGTSGGLARDEDQKSMHGEALLAAPSVGPSAR
jgi:hypothetical protein